MLYVHISHTCVLFRQKSFFFLVFFLLRFYFYRKSEVINNFCSCGPFLKIGTVFESPEHTGSESVVVLCVG